MVAEVPGTRLMLPSPSTHTLALILPPMSAEPVVSAVVLPAASYSEEPAAHFVASPAFTLSVTVVVFLFFHLIVPPVASCVPGIGFDAPPVFPVQVLKTTLVAMFPLRLLHAMPGFAAPAGLLSASTAAPATATLATERPI